MQKYKGIEKIKDILLLAILANESGELRSILFGKPLVYYLGKDFSQMYMNLRKEKKVFLQSLRCTEQNFDAQEHKKYQEYLKEIKHVSVKHNFHYDGIFLWDDKVACFDMKNDICYYLSASSDVGEYRDFFELYWND